MTIVQTLVLHFNAFNGKLEAGYWRSTVNGVQTAKGAYMRPAEVYAYLAKHPETRCHALRV